MCGMMIVIVVIIITIIIGTLAPYRAAYSVRNPFHCAPLSHWGGSGFSEILVVVVPEVKRHPMVAMTV